VIDATVLLLPSTGVGRSSIPVIVALFLGAVALGTIVLRSRRR
jgi:LPXTG-motif cell wall-anchored protein